MRSRNGCTQRKASSFIPDGSPPMLIGYDYRFTEPPTVLPVDYLPVLSTVGRAGYYEIFRK